MWYDTPRELQQHEAGDLLAFGSSTLEHTEARGLYEMWNALRGDRPVPFRAELDAHRIGAKAPFLAILEYVGPSNFRIRIAGDRLNKWFGLELRGMSALSLLDNDARNHFQAALNRVTAEPAVAAVHGAARGPDDKKSRFELVLMPMRSDFGRIDRVLVGLWLLDIPALSKGPFRLEPTEFTISTVDGMAVEDLPTTETADVPAESAPVALRSVEGTGDSTADRPEELDVPSTGRRRGHLRVIK